MGTILIRFSWPTLLVKSLVSQETLFRNNICTYPWSDKCKYILGEHFLLIFDYCGNYNSYPEFASYDQMQTIYPWFRFSYQCTSRKASLETDNLEFWYNSLVWQVQHTLYDNTSTFNHSPYKPNGGVQSHNKSHPGHGASSVKIQSLFWNEIWNTPRKMSMSALMNSQSNVTNGKTPIGILGTATWSSCCGTLSARIIRKATL